MMPTYHVVDLCCADRVDEAHSGLDEEHDEHEGRHFGGEGHSSAEMKTMAMMLCSSLSCSSSSSSLVRLSVTTAKRGKLDLMQKSTIGQNDCLVLSCQVSFVWPAGQTTYVITPEHCMWAVAGACCQLSPLHHALTLH